MPSFITQAHGKAAAYGAVAVIELPKLKDMAAGVPAPSGLPAPSPAPVARRADGRVADPQAAAELGRRGALAKHARARELRALEGLGLRGATPATLAPYLADAQAFAEAEVARLAQVVGGGICGAAPASFCQNAALSLAASRYLYSTGDAAQLGLAAKLAADSRQHLLAAHELCAREAKARPAPEDEWAVHARRVNEAAARERAERERAEREGQVL